MEADDDLRIREKLREWETTPYAMDKERLWENHLPFPKANAGRRMALYYVAASLTLAAAIFYYAVSERQLPMAELRIKELEAALMDAKSTNAPSEAMTATIPCPERPADPPNRRKSPRRQAKAMLRPSNVAVAQTESQATEPGPIVQTAEQPPEIVVSPAPEVSAVPSTPRIILGRAGVAQTTQQSPGRLRFNLFRNEEARDARQSAPPPVVILAGINN